VVVPRLSRALRGFALLLIAVGALGVAACGGDDEPESQTVVVTETVTEDPAPAQTSTREEPELPKPPQRTQTTETPTPPGRTPTDELVAQLEQAGFTAVPDEVESPEPLRAAARVELGGGALVLVHRYATEAAAESAVERYRSDEQERPDSIEVAIAGPTIYTAVVEEPAQVSETDLQRVMMALGDA
jgi:hypothetical protein